MTEIPRDCERFEAWLLERAEEADSDEPRGHAVTCAACRAQWQTHRLLTAAFAGATRPELSPSFDARLRRRIEASSEIRPLRGWRLAGMAGYALVAASLLGRLFSEFPPLAIESSSPWTMIAALVAAPLSLWLTAAATRMLPTARARGGLQLGP